MVPGLNFKKVVLLLGVGIVILAFLMWPATRIDRAITALQNMVQEDGRIVYEIDFLENHPSYKSNTVREMGSAYALAFAYYQTGDKTLKKPLQKIMVQMEKRCFSFGNYYCFIPESKDKIKVGATALALLAELYYEQASGDFSFSDLRRKMVNALVFSFKDGKGVSASPFEPDRTSPYYDGETWFALSVYHLFHPEDQKVARLLPRMDETMFNLYQDHYLISFVQWGTMAASHRFRATKDSKFVDFLKTQFDLYVQEKPIPDSGSSTCSVSEGLSDIVFFLAETDPDFAQKVLNRVTENKKKIEDLQVLSDSVKGEKAEHFPHIHPETRKYIGAFLNARGNYATRNDITQHCLIALLKHKRAAKTIRKYAHN